MKILTRDDTDHNTEYVTRKDAEHKIQGWKNKWKCAVDMAAKAEVYLDEWNELRRTNEGLQLTFDLRWKADQRAIKRWQAAHPGNDLTWPDHADMVVWLLDQISTATAVAGELIACIRINHLRGTFASASREEIEEWIKPWIARLESVRPTHRICPTNEIAHARAQKKSK